MITEGNPSGVGMELSSIYPGGGTGATGSPALRARDVYKK